MQARLWALRPPSPSGGKGTTVLPMLPQPCTTRLLSHWKVFILIQENRSQRPGPSGPPEKTFLLTVHVPRAGTGSDPQAKALPKAACASRPNFSIVSRDAVAALASAPRTGALRAASVRRSPHRFNDRRVTRHLSLQCHRQHSPSWSGRQTPRETERPEQHNRQGSADLSECWHTQRGSGGGALPCTDLSCCLFAHTRRPAHRCAAAGIVGG